MHLTQSKGGVRGAKGRGRVTGGDGLVREGLGPRGGLNEVSVLKALAAGGKAKTSTRLQAIPSKTFPLFSAARMLCAGPETKTAPSHLLAQQAYAVSSVIF